MQYSFFLFCQLYRDIIKPTDEQTYDLMFEDLVDLYWIYDTSEFNSDKHGEYECMVNFLQDLKTKQQLNNN
jgi:hypothetical protein